MKQYHQNSILQWPDHYWYYYTYFVWHNIKSYTRRHVPFLCRNTRGPCSSPSTDGNPHDGRKVQKSLRASSSDKYIYPKSAVPLRQGLEKRAKDVSWISTPEDLYSGGYTQRILPVRHPACRYDKREGRHSKTAWVRTHCVVSRGWWRYGLMSWWQLTHVEMIAVKKGSFQSHQIITKNLNAQSCFSNLINLINACHLFLLLNLSNNVSYKYFGDLFVFSFNHTFQNTLL